MYTIHRHSVKHHYNIPLTFSGARGSFQATLKWCFTSSASPIRAPLLAEMYTNGMPCDRAISEALWKHNEDEANIQPLIYTLYILIHNGSKTLQFPNPLFTCNTVQITLSIKGHLQLTYLHFIIVLSHGHIVVLTPSFNVIMHQKRYPLIVLTN